MTSHDEAVDDGWSLDEDPGRKPDRPRRDARTLVAIIREALTILDGREPVDIPLAGDGWSLVDPDSVLPGPQAAPDRLEEPTRNLRRRS